MGRRWRGPAVPGIEPLRHYRRPWLRGDALAGITVAAYLIPQVMAYAEVAGLPAAAGLWTAVVALLVYALLGSSRQLSVGPESTTALLTATTIGPLAAGDPQRYATLAAALAVLVGGMCLVGWLGRLGFTADLLSKPVLTGYLAGVAVTVAASQLGKLTGVPVTGDTVAAQLGSFVRHLDRVHAGTLLLSVAVLAFLVVAGRRFPHAPVPLAAMLLAAAAVAALHLRDHGIRVTGPIPAELPGWHPSAISATDLGALLVPALGITIVAYTDNVLTGRAFADRRGYHIDANQELLALGAANAAAGAVGGFPVSSSGSRTLIGDALGSRTQLYSLIALTTVLAALLAGRPLLAAFPLAALAALILYAAAGLIQLDEFRRFARFRRSELILALATTAGVLTADILYGVLIAVALSILDMLRRVARPHDAVLGYAPGIAGMHDIADYPDARLVPGLVVYRYDAPLCFANAEDFKRRALAAVDAADGTPAWFLLDAETNADIDITAADALDELRETLDRRGVLFAMARVKHELHDQLAATGFIRRLEQAQPLPHPVFPTLPVAVAAYHRWRAERGAAPPDA